MDKAELLKELLSDPETLETLKKLLLEEKPKRKPVKKKVAKKPSVKKTTAKKSPTKKIDKSSREYGRKEFIDDLTEAVVENINGKNVNLIAHSKKISKTTKKKPPRDKQRPEMKVCDCGKKFESFGGYVCDKCLKGRSINVE